MLNEFNAGDARRLTEEKNNKVKSFICHDKINTILDGIKDKITSYKVTSFHTIRCEYRWDGSLTQGEKEYLTKDGFTIAHEDDHYDSWYLIKW